LESSQLGNPEAWGITRTQRGGPLGAFAEWFRAGRFEESAHLPLDLRQANLPLATPDLCDIHVAHLLVASQHA
jgi:hypothetical protein